EADKRGRRGAENTDYPQADYVRAAHAAAAEVDALVFVEQGLTGPAIGEAVRKARAHTIASVREHFA
ncbi:MAG TPA: multifunctional CCA tRNA nucleotidyl transferase/2'3'-cyclic phosphodiesterase/2'nucleotidase/phosphatase, partial [Rhodanobacteraceae bacterium]|nr:multifunctional CCA tRNA nucleotidyl transferase/2'3'-cyclic phosphodiesterase/2'nucleotidase/phosphatase [Rhodanobacteraceae bacterium]